MQEAKNDLLQGNVLAMLAKMSLQANKEMSESKQNLYPTREEKREIQRKQDNLFGGTPAMRVPPCRLYDEGYGDSS